LQHGFIYFSSFAFSSSVNSHRDYLWRFARRKIIHEGIPQIFVLF